jgi:hypothetical protein
MRRKVKTIKLCVNCTHLQVIGEGQEIKGLEETAYLETSCDVFEHTTRELYQFPSGESPLILDNCGSTDCPFWQAWDLSQKVIEDAELREDIEVDQEQM